MPRLFEPVGDVPRWRLIYDLLAQANVNDVVTYEELAKVLDVDPDMDRHIIQGNIARASTELLVEHKHAIENARGVGYRVVQAEEHLGLAQKRSVRARNQIGKATAVVKHVDYNELAGEVRRKFEAAGQVLAWQTSMMAQLDLRQQDLEERMAGVQATVRQTQRDAETTHERLAWLEAQLNKRSGGDGPELRSA